MTLPVIVYEHPMMSRFSGKKFMKRYRYRMRNNLKSLTLAVFILFFGAQVFADFQDGEDAYKNGDYATALKG